MYNGIDGLKLEMNDLDEIIELQEDPTSASGYKLYDPRTQTYLENNAENRLTALICRAFQELEREDKDIFPLKNCKTAEDFAKILVEIFDTVVKNEDEFDEEGQAEFCDGCITDVFDLEPYKDNITYDDKTKKLILDVLKDHENPATKIVVEKLVNKYKYLEEKSKKFKQDKENAKFVRCAGINMLYQTETGKYIKNTPLNRTKALFSELLIAKINKDMTFPNENNNVEKLAQRYVECLEKAAAHDIIGEAEVNEFLNDLVANFGLSERFLIYSDFKSLVLNVLNDQKDPKTQIKADVLTEHYKLVERACFPEEKEME